MAKQTGINMPAGFGGLTRFSEEFQSKFDLRPIHVIIFILLIVGFRAALGWYF